jgi:peptide/nickel transport system substrate-binding protein
MRGQDKRRPGRFRLRLAGGLCAVVGVALVAGCSSGGGGGGSTSSSGNSSTGAAAPHKGGSLTIINNQGTGFDPAHNYISTFTDGPAMEAIYGPGLLYEAADGTIKMGFATSLVGSNNNTTWTLKLKPGLKFSDGTAFNAQSVVDNLNRIADPATGSSEQTVASTIKASASDATTVVFTLQAENAQFPALLSQDFSLIPSPAAVAKYGSTYNVHPVGPGPFQLQTLVPAVSEKMVPNPYYTNFAPGQPYLSSLTFEAVSDNSQALADMQTGQAQVDSNVINGLTIQQMQGAGMTVIATHPVGGAWLDLNESKPPFNNMLARQAVYLALDRAKVGEIWAQGNPVSTNFYPTTSPYYDAKNNWPAQDTAKAQQLFNQLAAQGDPVNFTILWPQGTYSAAAQYMASVLNGFKNVHVTTSVVLSPQYLMALNQTGDYQMTAYGFYNSQLFPTVGQIFTTGGALNYEKINDPKLSAAVLAMQNASGQAAIKTASDAFLQELIAQYHIIPTQQGDIGFAYNPKVVSGVQVTEFGIPAFYGEMYMLNQ